MPKNQQEVKSKTILIVEDYDDIREPLKLWLELFGYQVMEATDGDQAIEYVKKAVPDLILMDISLPDKKGITATKQIRDLDEGKHLPVIVFTHSNDGLHSQARQAGCNDLIEKPVDFGKLESILNQYLGH